MSPNINFVAENNVPNGATEGVTSFGKSGWGGPCPPSGTHHYHFKLYALDIPKLNLPSSTTVVRVMNAMAGHIVGTAELVGLYQRQY